MTLLQNLRPWFKGLVAKRQRRSIGPSASARSTVASQTSCTSFKGRLEGCLDFSRVRFLAFHSTFEFFMPVCRNRGFLSWLT